MALSVDNKKLNSTYSIYSLTDLSCVMSYGTTTSSGTKDFSCVLSETGGGKLTISRSGDISSHTATATGYVVVNRVRSHAAQVALEVAANSYADQWLRRWVDWCANSAKSADFASATLTVKDTAGNITFSMTGVTPQKRPDVSYDQTSGTVQYALLAAEVTES